ncbi:hypothetical protein PCE1_001567 [Barthelona sp. PCE]
MKNPRVAFIIKTEEEALTHTLYQLPDAIRSRVLKDFREFPIGGGLDIVTYCNNFAVTYSVRFLNTFLKAFMQRLINFIPTAYSKLNIKTCHCFQYIHTNRDVYKQNVDPIIRMYNSAKEDLTVPLLSFFNIYFIIFFLDDILDVNALSAFRDAEIYIPQFKRDLLRSLNILDSKVILSFNTVFDSSISSITTHRLIDQLPDMPPITQLQKKGRSVLEKDRLMKEREDSGELAFKFIYNLPAEEPDDEMLIMLTKAKSLFHRQLPKMPYDYLCSLVFNPRHRTCICIKDNCPEDLDTSSMDPVIYCARFIEVYGAICFRPVPEREFAEVVFVAVSSDLQIGGIGTRMMNHVKHHCRSLGISFMLTYADNTAVAFFRKQGFSPHLTEYDKWIGYIKDYEGSTLMQCFLFDEVDYLNFPMQYDRIELIIRKRLKSAVIPIQKGISIDSRDIFYHENTDTPAHYLSHNNLVEVMHDITETIFNNIVSWPFRAPVVKAEAENYFDIVREPIVILDILKKLADDTIKVQLDEEDGGIIIDFCRSYRTINQFMADWATMLSNCRSFNTGITAYSLCADKLETLLMRLMEQRLPDLLIEYQNTTVDNTE